MMAETNCPFCRGGRRVGEWARSLLADLAHLVRPCVLCGALLLVEGWHAMTHPPKSAAQDSISAQVSVDYGNAHTSGAGELGNVSPLPGPGFAYLASGQMVAPLVPGSGSVWPVTG
jgi:hypothetical protein